MLAKKSSNKIHQIFYQNGAKGTGREKDDADSPEPLLNPVPSEVVL